MQQLRLIVMVIVFCMAVVPFAADGAGPKTYLGVSGVSFDYIPFWYAKDYRLYQKYNVDVDIITTGGGTVLAQAMLSGGVTRCSQFMLMKSLPNARFSAAFAG
jgi:ABC-type nitrate/sulfonate/bicarbonate transport system substrate-binding protein